MLNRLTVKNETTLINNGTISGKMCSILQNNLTQFVASEIFGYIVDTVSKDDVINRASATSNQTAEVKQSGISELTDSLFKGFTGLINASIIPMVIIGAVILLTIVFGGVQGLNAVRGMFSSIFSLKTLTIILFVLTVYLVAAYFTRIPPFKKYTGEVYYTCSKNVDGDNDGGCVAINLKTLQSLPKDATSYNTLSDCQKDIAGGGACKQYWRCEADTSGWYTGKVVQCHDLFDEGGVPCVFSNKQSAMISCSNFTYECDKPLSTSADAKPSCKQINYDMAGNQVVYQDTNKDIALSKCQAECK